MEKISLIFLYYHLQKRVEKKVDKKRKRQSQRDKLSFYAFEEMKHYK